MHTSAMRTPHAIPSRLSAAKFSFILEPSSLRLVRLLLGGVTVVLLATAAAAFVSPVGTFNPNFKASVSVGKPADTAVADARTIVDSLSAVDASPLAASRIFADAQPIVGVNVAGTVRVNNLA